ncbi:MAG: hypothetical protein HRU36_05780 [Rickettsiales bacterium]|nr:hypothetical protein [Rickettsiales bacterium]
MFKIICDVKEVDLTKITKSLPIHGDSIAPAVKNHNVIIKYENCKMCSLEGLGLTSTNIRSSFIDRQFIIDVWNRNGLNPKNKIYYESYKSILEGDLADSFDNNAVKFIALFDTDKGVLSEIKDQEWYHVSEFIVDTHVSMISSAFNENGYKTGYKEYHEMVSEFWVTNVTHSTFMMSSVVYETDKYRYKIANTAIAYSLRYKGALECVEDFYNEDQTSLQEYWEFAETDLMEQLHYKLCEDDIGECNIEFMRQSIENICQKSIPDYLVHNDISSITCQNYESYLNIYKEQDILGNFSSYTYGAREALHHDNLE